jgi:hypothetical protein
MQSAFGDQVDAATGLARAFGVGTIYRTLTNTTYMGEWKFNRMSSRTGMEPRRRGRHLGRSGDHRTKPV